MELAWLDCDDLVAFMLEGIPFRAERYARDKQSLC
jgi:hypothetical protein